MCRRVISVFCTAAFVIVLCGVNAEAAPGANRSRDKMHASHRPAPLVSAMFLVSAGMGFTLLFDKREGD